VRQECGWRTSKDAVVVGGKALRLHQRLPPAVRAAREIGMLLLVAVERVDDHFSDLGHLMEGAVAKVDYLLRMTQRPASVSSPCRVPRIGCGGGILFLGPLRQAAISKPSGAASVSPPP